MQAQRARCDMVNGHSRRPAVARAEDVVYGKHGPAFVSGLLAASRIVQIFSCTGGLIGLTLP